MTLTEQWKKGELEQGWYYIECIDLPKRWIDIDYYRNDCYEDEGFCKGFFDHNDWRGIDKVLAPVPSYDHFVELTEKVKKPEQDHFSQEGKMLVMKRECNAILDDESVKYLTGQIKLTSSKNELIRYLEYKAWRLKEENQQLKGYNEYLRNIIIECEPYIENVCTALNMEKFANGGFLHKSNELLSKIRTTIGEK